MTTQLQLVVVVVVVINSISLGEYTDIGYLKIVLHRIFGLKREDITGGWRMQWTSFMILVFSIFH